MADARAEAACQPVFAEAAQTEVAAANNTPHLDGYRDARGDAGAGRCGSAAGTVEIVPAAEATRAQLTTPLVAIVSGKGISGACAAPSLQKAILPLQIW